MKSMIASLRSLTLPFGATEGQRIELDGINGEIRVYDTDGDLLIKIDGEFGFEGYDPEGDLRVRLSTPLLGQYSSVKLWTSDANEQTPATISHNTSTLGQRARTDYTPGDYGKGCLGLHLFASSANDVQPSLIQVSGDSLINQGATTQPYIDLTGADIDVAAMALRTVVNDLFYGSQNGLGNLPTVAGNYPRGIIAKVRRTTDLTFGTTTSQDYQAMQLPACTLISGRRYKLSFFWRSLAYGTAAAPVIIAARFKNLSSTQRCETLVEVDGGSGREGGICETIIDCPSEIASGSHTFEAVFSRVTGSGTILANASGTTPMYCAVEDVGGTSNS